MLTPLEGAGIRASCVSMVKQRCVSHNHKPVLMTVSPVRDAENMGRPIFPQTEKLKRRLKKKMRPIIQHDHDAGINKTLSISTP